MLLIAMVTVYISTIYNQMNGSASNISFWKWWKEWNYYEINYLTLL